MICITCKSDIPPAWKSCIQKNVCPACDGAIFDDDSKALLEELTEAMAKMPNDSVGLAGWLLSNFKLKKLGKLEPTTFYGNVQEEMPPMKIHQPKAGIQIRTNDKKLSKWASLVNEIHNSEDLPESSIEDEIADEENEENEIVDEIVDENFEQYQKTVANRSNSLINKLRSNNQKFTADDIESGLGGNQYFSGIRRRSD